MRYARPVVLALSLAALATAATAGNGPGKPGAHKGPGPKAALPCPPGLAKKNPPCVPPGQARHQYRYRVGERINSGYVILGDPWRYDLDPNQTYYRVGDYLYRVNRDTREVLDFLGAAAALLD
ncbi:excinuclease ABC subunit A [Marimonas arenosa]|uniref:Excinuclease ABC subunit A n=1 Tax=Marimonas arenosa TaxID=1795305 RepID=A0AAE4B597_9RHOB|nr:excinuclease ABC subunit A [Marimonas arenosa]MDQ2089031.1 excinuclease ABC subunit A [Marimonas arenosa]